MGEGRFDVIPECDYLIYQNALPAFSARQPDLILPSGLFSESSGSIINSEGRLLKIEKATGPFMDAKPDWWIMSRIAEKLGKGKFKYKDVAAIQAEIKKQVGGFANGKQGVKFAKVTLKGTGKWLKSPPKKDRQDVRVAVCESYRGVPLSQAVAGMKVLEASVQSAVFSSKEAQ
jgi:predicted molibdopterin-dependent oxidoreductase YjgC